jgi:hypothetical protein
MNENDARERIRNLKSFYTNLTVYVATCLSCVLVWMFQGGTFWPIWVIVGYGISIFLQALKLGKVPVLEEFLPFLNSSWEEEELNRMIKKNDSSNNNDAKKINTEPHDESHH